MAPQKPFLINALRGAHKKIYCHPFYDALRFMFIGDLKIIPFLAKTTSNKTDPHDFYEVCS